MDIDFDIEQIASSVGMLEDEKVLEWLENGATIPGASALLSRLSQDCQCDCDEEWESKKKADRLRKIKFTKAEDTKILQLTGASQKHDWGEFSKHFPERSANSIRNRYNRLKQLSSEHLGRSKWTSDDDEMIRKQFNIHGPHWRKIRKMLPTRTDDAIRNRAKRLNLF